ncbi:hypothetical protein [Novosphingobium aquimarinum]|nr:hypothetical protein [Novosphingobium aquimarinum]
MSDVTVLNQTGAIQIKGDKVTALGRSRNGALIAFVAPCADVCVRGGGER